MQRKIAFRAWDKEDKRWIKQERFFVMGDGELGSYGSYDDTGSFENEIALMQFTGLKDKNGKEIYEGDVVKNYIWDFGGEVVWNEKYAMFGVKAAVGLRNMWPRIEDDEVIGNIYENPELINSTN